MSWCHDTTTSWSRPVNRIIRGSVFLVNLVCHQGFGGRATATASENDWHAVWMCSLSPVAMPHIVKSTSRHPHHRIEWLDMGIYPLTMTRKGFISCVKLVFSATFCVCGIFLVRILAALQIFTFCLQILGVWVGKLHWSHLSPKLPRFSSSPAVSHCCKTFLHCAFSKVFSLPAVSFLSPKRLPLLMPRLASVNMVVPVLMIKLKQGYQSPSPQPLPPLPTTPPTLASCVS